MRSRKRSSPAGVDKPRILIERFTTGPLSAAQAAAARALEEKAAGLKMRVTLNGRRVHGRLRSGEALYPRQRPRRRPACAVRLQRRRLRHLPRQGHRRRSEHEGELRAVGGGTGRRLRAHLPGHAADGWRGADVRRVKRRTPNRSLDKTLPGQARAHRGCVRTPSRDPGVTTPGSRIAPAARLRPGSVRVAPDLLHDAQRAHRSNGSAGRSSTA